MSRLIFTLGILFVFACKKIEIPTTPPVVVIQEEAIKFTTNLDTGTYNVADTLPLVVTVSSKLPSAGVLYSILVNWTDSSKQIFKLDSSLTVSSLSLNIPGLKKSGTYSLSVTITSKSTSSNTTNKSISVVNNPLGRFVGYKVDQIGLALSRQKDFGKSYWKNVGIPGDMIIAAFQSKLGFLLQLSFGDFNNDGFIDVFNPGSKYQTTLSYATFLVWNPLNKTFEKKNLFNNISDSVFGGNKHQTIPIYLNNDNYVDFVIFDNGDEYLGGNAPNEPVRLVLSDGKGKYDLKEIQTNENEVAQNANHKGNGDVDDINGDGLPDLAFGTGSKIYIYWGINVFPYFKQTGRAAFAADSYNPAFLYQENGFGEHTLRIGWGSPRIFDINLDGKKDLIITNAEDSSLKPFPAVQQILINQGQGKFNDSKIINLPLYKEFISATDGFADDMNGDGLIDIATLNINKTGLNWNIFIYLQQKDGSFQLNLNSVVYTINNLFPRFGGLKEYIFYKDINGDGLKDIGYYEGATNANQYLNKSVFIRIGNQFIEQDYYQYDPYSKYLSSKIN
jgi:hypothetical protein